MSSQLVMQNKICKLDENIANSIKSSTVFQSYHDIIEELVLNSIDSQATFIEIGIDRETYDINVKDNGNDKYLQYLYLLL